jgi:hypothetical protein
MKKQNVVQAYSQAPWRSQIQYAGLVLLGLVGLLVIAGVYLYISGETAAAGVEIQNIDYDKQTTQREIADLESKLAYLTSAAEMERRAKEIGFEQVKAEQISYVSVTEYPGRQAVILAPPPGYNAVPQAVIKESYTQSLWEWIMEDIVPMNVQFAEASR